MSKLPKLQFRRIKSLLQNQSYPTSHAQINVLAVKINLITAQTVVWAHVVCFCACLRTPQLCLETSHGTCRPPWKEPRVQRACLIMVQLACLNSAFGTIMTVIQSSKCQNLCLGTITASSNRFVVNSSSIRYCQIK